MVHFFICRACLYEILICSTILSVLLPKFPKGIDQFSFQFLSDIIVYMYAAILYDDRSQDRCNNGSKI